MGGHNQVTTDSHINMYIMAPPQPQPNQIHPTTVEKNKRTDENIAFPARDGVAAVQHVARVGDHVPLLCVNVVFVLISSEMGGAHISYILLLS